MKKKKIFIRLATIAICALLLLVAAAALLAASIFSDEPATQQVQLSFDDLRLQRNLARRISNEIAESKLLRSRIVLSEEDIASLIRSADCTMAVAALANPKLAKLPPLRSFAPSLCDGVFSVTIPYDTEIKSLFGGWLIAKFDFRASYSRGKLDLVPVSGRVGKLALPEFILKRVFDRLETELKKRPEYKIFTSVVLSISVNEDGDLEIVYDPTAAAAMAARRYTGGNL
ncbi:MAG: hypothetical protein PHI35_04720 [Victivallaceae bacterium]|nr:hypothetical protein [Victivallaceae bacterium]